MSKYIQPTAEAGKAFYQKFQDKGKIVMLNLLKFREQADYTDLEHLAPAEPVSGEKAYRIYMKCTLPEIEKVGGKPLVYGKSGHFLIGPEAEKWDAFLLVEYESVAKFMTFANSADYLKTAGHRTAALEDSRLLPIGDFQLLNVGQE